MRSSTSTPHEIARAARDVLGEIPLTFVQLHAAVSAPPSRGGSDVKVAGGTRNFVPINAHADAAKFTLLDTVRHVHWLIAEQFGEQHSRDIGIQSACADLLTWVDVWSWHPSAADWLHQLRQQLDYSQRMTGATSWISKRGAVCPECLQVGCLEENTETDEHRCTRSGMTWSLEQYMQAVVVAAELTRSAGSASSEAA